MKPSIDWHESGGIVTLTISRPEARNALDGPAMETLSEMVDRLHEQPGLRGVILTGQSGRSSARVVISSGCVVSDTKGWSCDGRHMHGIVQRLDALSQPIVVVVNGYALGGAELALAGASQLSKTTVFCASNKLRWA